MRLIDADKLDWWYKGRPIRRVIDEAPTVDAVEVVRCKDCKWHDFNECTCPYIDLSDGSHMYTGFDDFCSYGERRIDK